MIETLAIERACERLILDFAYFSDHVQYESLVQLFTPDGVMHRPNGDLLEGRDAILKAYRARPAGRITRHICTNIRISVESADSARGLTYAMLYSGNSNEPANGHFGFKVEQQLVGEFEDEFVRTAEGWRIGIRRARFMMHT
jgi:hypothetical protein